MCSDLTYLLLNVECADFSTLIIGFHNSTSQIPLMVFIALRVISGSALAFFFLATAFPFGDSAAPEPFGCEQQKCCHCAGRDS